MRKIELEKLLDSALCECEMLRERFEKAISEKNAAVKACRKYREKNKALIAENEMLKENLDSLMYTYAENDAAFSKALQNNMFLAGKLTAYEAVEKSIGVTTDG